MKSYLFLFSISPVQSFIEQARKTQDLYAGSVLLSHLCKKVLMTAQEKYQAKIIFPHISNESIPNRFVAIIQNSESDLEKIGKELEQIVYKEFSAIANSILKQMHLPKPYHFDEQIFNQFTIEWAFVPDSGDYASEYNELERLHGSLKNVRRFEQFEEKGRKCSLNGVNNALFFKRRTNGLPPTYIDKNTNNLGEPTEIEHDPRIQPGEGLSAVSFVKRFLSSNNVFPIKEKSFPSTARVALMNIIDNEKIVSRCDDLGMTVRWYKDFIENLKGDEQLFFEENLTKNYFRKNGLENNLTVLPQLKRKQEILRKLAWDRGITFTKYYALIIFDGDDMGEWLSGARLSDGSKEKLFSFHTTLSRNLGEFANFASEYLVPPLGKTVYAGGDDF